MKPASSVNITEGLRKSSTTYCCKHCW